MAKQLLSEFHSSLLEFLMMGKQGLMNVSKDYDLTPLQATTVVLIDNNHPKPMNAFQKLYNCDASNITGIIDGLEEKNLATRAEHPEDRRVKTIQLTTKGLKVQQQLINGFVQIDNLMLKDLTPKELAAFKSIIIKIVSK